MSYWRDSRVRGGQRARNRRYTVNPARTHCTWLIDLTFDDNTPDDAEHHQRCNVDPDAHGCDCARVITLPVTWEACPTCEGKGKHVNPSIDAHGITSSEWAEWDHDERVAYRSGRYDVDCYACGGERVSPVVAEQHLNAAQRADYAALRGEWAQLDAIDAEERAEREGLARMAGDY